MRQPMTGTPDEILALAGEMYPQEIDRVMAEMTIRKQREYIGVLEEEIAKINATLDRTHAED